jgi:hypothetical protein
MPARTRFHVIDLVPFAPAVAGILLSTWRFRAHDGVGGLAFGLGGMLLMIVLAVRLPRPKQGDGPRARS